jgi:hypothetical protein
VAAGFLFRQNDLSYELAFTVMAAAILVCAVLALLIGSSSVSRRTVSSRFETLAIHQVRDNGWVPGAASTEQSG